MPAFRLTPEFPQRPQLRRALLLSQGLNRSDVRVFEFILQRTVLNQDQCATASLSANQIAATCRLNRRTVVRAMARLRAADLIHSVRDAEWRRQKASHVGPAVRIIEAAPSTGGLSLEHVTSSTMIRYGLHNLDCFDGMPRVEPHSVQLVLTDLPTGATANDWDTPLDLSAFWRSVERILKPDGAVVIIAAFPYDKILGMSNFSALKDEYHWEKKPTNFFNAAHQPLRAYETILVFSKGTPIYNPQMALGGKPYRKKRGPTQSGNYHGSTKSTVTISDGSRFPTSVLRYERDRDNPHPTGKPVLLLERLILTYSNPGDLICDPCAGSASTWIAAMNTNRQFVGFEKDSIIYEMAMKRRSAAQPDPRISGTRLTRS